MTKTNSKKALLSSAFALVLSVAMLIGTTFAWFTDTASTGVNKIVSGNLKVDIIGETSDSHISTLKFTKAGAETDAGAAEEILWEPGCRYLTEGFRIANKGNLALKWKAQVNMNNIINGKVEGSTIAKDGKSLLDVIDFYVVTSTDENAEAVAIENFVGNLKKTETSEVYYIKGVMQTTAGNDYQDLTLDGITVELAEDKQARLAAKDVAEQDVVLGVRPDHIMLCADGVKGKVDVSELMGSSVHLHISANGHDVVVIVPTNGNAAHFPMGSEVNMIFGGNVAHVFSKETEKNLEW